MSIQMIVVMALLFAVLSPGVFIWLPFGASRRVAALVHGFVFAIAWHFLHRPISQMLSNVRIFENMAGDRFVSVSAIVNDESKITSTEKIDALKKLNITEPKIQEILDSDKSNETKITKIKDVIKTITV
jgi:hypothetical protein